MRSTYAKNYSLFTWNSSLPGHLIFYPAAIQDAWAVSGRGFSRCTKPCGWPICLTCDPRIAPCLQGGVSLPLKQFGLRKWSVFTNSILMLEGFLCAERHCLNLQDSKSSHHELRAWRVLEEGKETRLKGDDKVKAEERVCQGRGLRRKQVTGPSHAHGLGTWDPCLSCPYAPPPSKSTHWSHQWALQAGFSVRGRDAVRELPQITPPLGKQSWDFLLQLVISNIWHAQKGEGKGNWPVTRLYSHLRRYSSGPIESLLSSLPSCLPHYFLTN